MSESTTEIGPGLYEFEDLRPFNPRQAWTARLAATPEKQSVSVGDDEIVWLSRAREKTGISRSSAEMSLIREVVQTGTAEIPRGRVNELSKGLQAELARTFLMTPRVENVLGDLQEAISEAEQQRVHERIHRAAGYIAVRQSLWVVTKSASTEPGMTSSESIPLTVGLARLMGLTIDTSETGVIQVHPVVSGKNKAVGWLKRREKGVNKRFRPNALDVIEGIRTRPDR